MILLVDSTNGVGDVEINIGVQDPGGVQGSESGIFSATVAATETPTDSECNPDNNTDSATATDTVGLASPPDSERLDRRRGQHGSHLRAGRLPGVDIPVTATTSAGSHLTTIVITGFPAGGGGFTIDTALLDQANTTVIYNVAAGTVTITFDDAVTGDFTGAFKVIPAGDSDVDLGTLTATLTAVDNVDPTVKLTPTSDQAFVRVDAVADGDDKGDDGDADKPWRDHRPDRQCGRASTRRSSPARLATCTSRPRSTTSRTARRAHTLTVDGAGRLHLRRARRAAAGRCDGVLETTAPRWCSRSTARTATAKTASATSRSTSR